jgi:hypothetical protein
MESNMAEPCNTVVHQIRAVDEGEFRSKFITLLHRLVGTHGEPKVALALGVTTRQMQNLYKGSLPGLHRAWNLLSLDPTAMDEIATLYGMQMRPAFSNAGDDLNTITLLADYVSQYLGVMSDGRRDHRETLQLADPARVLVSRLLAIVAEAEEIRKPKT